MSDYVRIYSLEECVLAIRSDPNSAYGFSDKSVLNIFLNTEIRSELDIEVLLKEMLCFRIKLVDKISEELSKKRVLFKNKKPPK
ncbi:MAG: hypothetical protein M1155_01990 [Patescibacteria group bacterium]|nr:hypothetical protein [Patescibacteria group bacterium]